MPEGDDLQRQHHAFNRATDILYSPEPSQPEIASLVELAHVAHWHWEHRTDKTAQNVAVALWLLSRAYSANFGYAHEALARANLLLGKTEEARSHLELARQIAETVPSPQAKRYLLDQIDRIQMPSSGS